MVIVFMNVTNFLLFHINFSDPREREVGVFARGDHTGFMTQTSSETLSFKLIDKTLHWEERGADVSVSLCVYEKEREREREKGRKKVEEGGRK